MKAEKNVAVVEQQTGDRPNETVTPNGRLSYSVEEVTEVTGLGRTSVYKAIQQGDLPAHKFGARTLILRDDLQQFLRNLPTTGEAV